MRRISEHAIALAIKRRLRFARESGGEEAHRTRRVLEHLPEGRNDRKPHPKSMPIP